MHQENCTPERKDLVKPPEGEHGNVNIINGQVLSPTAQVAGDEKGRPAQMVPGRGPPGKRLDAAGVGHCGMFGVSHAVGVN